MRILVTSLLLIPMIITWSNVAAQNVAFHKRYVLSVRPNYLDTASPTDSTSLTDGLYTKGGFWGSPTTVGWQNVDKVSITIDLGKIQRIKKITFNTARRFNAGVYFPKAIYALGSDNDMQYTYLGNLISDPINDTLSGVTEVRTFILHNISFDVRYLKVVVIPKGKFLFCDEIQVMKSESAVKISDRQVINKDKIDSFIKLKRIKDFETRLLQYHINLLKTNLGMNKDSDSLSIKNSRISNINDNSMNDSLQFDRLKTLHIEGVSNETKKPLVIELVNPWTRIREYNIPVDTSKLKSSFIVPQGGVQYGAFVVTNTTRSDQNISFSIENQNNISGLELFKAIFVPAMNDQTVPDPLVPISIVDIPAGQSQLFLFKLSGFTYGHNNSTIIVFEEGSRLATIEVLQRVVEIPGFTNNFCNANVWVYLNDPLVRNSDKTDIAEDLQKHHINTIDVPPTYIPKMGEDNFNKLITYIKHFSGIQNILLFVSHNYIANPAAKIPLLSDSWKAGFRLWYRNLLISLKQNNISANIYYYPYDEISNPEDIENFKAFIKWAVKTVPGFKVYGTISVDTAAKDLIPLLNISQIHQNNHLLSSYIGKSFPARTWGYWVMDSSRLLSPYFGYRLMGWKAFVTNLTGIGFWSYDDGPVVWNSLDSLRFWLTPRNNYAVIYKGRNNQIISSRRWEAFSLGIEDYSILKIYSMRFSRKNALKLAVEVINSADVNKADDIKNYMLRKLIDE